MGEIVGPEVMVGDAARILHCSVQHVRYLERTGQIRCKRVGLYRVFLRKEVEQLAAERYRRATGQAHFHVEGAH